MEEDSFLSAITRTDDLNFGGFNERLDAIQ
jgi:hypothetical protein